MGRNTIQFGVKTRREMILTVPVLLTYSVIFSSVASQDLQDREKQRNNLQRRCFTCRSRGERGDCRDPFEVPEEPEGAERRESVNRAVSQIPCSTGWCSKKVEGLDKNFGDNDYGIATERQCMERAPSDNQERCAFVKHNHKQVYMCFCKGDLCNVGHRQDSPPLLVALLVITGLALQILL